MSTVSTSFAPYAFTVVDQSCAAGYLSYAHEVGHNEGLQHDPANAGSAPSYPFAYGYQDPAGQFRTVLSYGGETRVPYFSSPLVKYNNMPTGTASQDNARALNNNVAHRLELRGSASGGVDVADRPHAVHVCGLVERGHLQRTSRLLVSHGDHRYHVRMEHQLRRSPGSRSRRARPAREQSRSR